MALADIYFVGGFGSMGWVAPAEYMAAAVDPLAEAATDLIREMNATQQETLLLLARVCGNLDAQQASITTMDRLGFHLRVKTPDRMQVVDSPLRTRCTMYRKLAPLSPIWQARRRLGRKCCTPVTADGNLGGFAWWVAMGSAGITSPRLPSQSPRAARPNADSSPRGG